MIGSIRLGGIRRPWSAAPSYARAAWSWLALGDPQAIPGLSRALDVWGVTTHQTKTIVLDSKLAPLVHYTLLLSPVAGGAGPERAGTATAAPGSSGTRGVIIFWLGDGELAKFDLYAAPQMSNEQ